MQPRRWIPIAVVLFIAMIMIIAASTWAVRSREALEVTELRQLTKKLFDPNVEQQQRVELGEKMQQLKQNIREDRKQGVYREMGEAFREQINAHVRKFAALPEEERNAFLDRDIEMKRMSARGDGQRKDGPRGRREKKPSKFDSMSQEQLAALKRAKLDHTSAEDRAYMTEYIRALKQRSEQRGIKSWDKD